MEILIPLEGTSPTGLQAKELMGLTVNAVNELSDSDVKDFEEFYSELYTRAYRALELDATKILSGIFRFEDGSTLNGKFLMNRKIASLATSIFTTTLAPGVGNSGVRVQWTPSLYSAVQVGRVVLNIQTLGSASPPQATVRIVDNVSGVTLLEKTFVGVTEGFNDLALYYDVTVEDFSILLVNDQNQYYGTNQLFLYGGQWIDEDLSCSCEYGTGNLISSQVNGGGINAFLTAYCSVARFIDQNVAVFKFPLYYSIGREFMKERIASDRVNQYTMLTIERATQLLEAYEKDYASSLQTLRDVSQIPEDTQCFACKRSVYSRSILP